MTMPLGNAIIETIVCASDVGYWAAILDDDVDAGTLTVDDMLDDDSAPYRLTAADMLEAAHKVIELYPQARSVRYIRSAIANNDPGAMDAECVDMILQVATLGRITYG